MVLAGLLVTVLGFVVSLLSLAYALLFIPNAATRFLREGEEHTARLTGLAERYRRVLRAAMSRPRLVAGVVPPVEEPAPTEEAVGVVTHYYSDLGVAVVQMNKGALRTNDRIRIKGQTTDRTQVVGSIEYEHQHVDQAEAGQCVGIKVFDHARVHDIVYLVK